MRRRVRKSKLYVVYKDHASSMTTIRYWFNEFITETEAYFEEFDKSYVLDSIKMLEYRWAIELKGNYVKKYKKKN